MQLENKSKINFIKDIKIVNYNKMRSMKEVRTCDSNRDYVNYIVV